MSGKDIYFPKSNHFFLLTCLYGTQVLCVLEPPSCCPQCCPPLYCVVGNLFKIQDTSLCQNPKKFFLATPNPLTLQHGLPHTFFSEPFIYLQSSCFEELVSTDLITCPYISLLSTFQLHIHFLVLASWSHICLTSAIIFQIPNPMTLGFFFPSMEDVTCSQCNSLTQHYITPLEISYFVTKISLD